jgi:cytochrome c oxidase subunit III
MGLLAQTGSGQGGPPPTEYDDFYGGSGGDPEDRGASRRNSLTGIVVLMCASVMTFSAFLSALIVRRGLGTDWRHIPLPSIFWWNTGILLLSSLVLDLARRKLRRGSRIAFNWLWLGGTLLGFAFLAGQVIGWEDLVNRGFHINGNISSSFFYILTWAHATHAIAGLVALVYVSIQAFRFQMGPAKRTAVTVSVVFWHFLDVLWLALMALFLFWF